MSVLHVLEVEILIGVGAFALAYGAISFVLWRLSKASERRIRERAARERSDRPDAATGSG